MAEIKASAPPQKKKKYKKKGKTRSDTCSMSRRAVSPSKARTREYAPAVMSSVAAQSAAPRASPRPRAPPRPGGGGAHAEHKPSPHGARRRRRRRREPGLGARQQQGGGGGDRGGAREVADDVDGPRRRGHSVDGLQWSEIAGRPPRIFVGARAGFSLRRGTFVVLWKRFVPPIHGTVYYCIFFRK